MTYKCPVCGKTFNACSGNVHICRGCHSELHTNGGSVKVVRKGK